MKEPRIRIERTRKPSTSFRLSILARRELEELVRRYDISRTAIVEIAIDRMYHEETERSAMSRMNYEAEPESIDERALDIARRVYSELYGEFDDKRHKAAKMGAIYDWLTDGDLSGDPDIAGLAAEWQECDETGIEGAPLV